MTHSFLERLLPEQLANLLADMLNADDYDADMLCAVSAALVSAIGVEDAAAIMAVRGIDIADIAKLQEDAQP